MLSRDDLDAIAASLRNMSLGYKRVKAEYEDLHEVSYYDLRVKRNDTAFRFGNVIEETASYIDSIVRGGASSFVEDSFIIDYDLRTNLLGKAVYGAIDCVGLYFRVKWTVREVKVMFYTISKPRLLKVPNDLKEVLYEGKVRNLAKFAEMTGLDERHVGPSEAQRLLGVFQLGSVIQCKLTRLVKGCLIYLDHLESGPKTYARADLRTLTYNVEELLATMDLWDTAYVYTKHETNSAYNLVLYAMCQQYPGQLFGGVEHVKIPADGVAIILVGYYSPMKHYRNVLVSAELVMGALIEYTQQFSLGEDLESAMIIACSLRQNRYLEKVGLPAVCSNCDLIYPVLSWTEEVGVRQKCSIYSNEAAIMLGRFHQMGCLVLFKDFDTSFRNTKERDRTMRSVFSMDIFTLIEYMEDQIGTGIFQMSNDMIWLKYLDDNAMARLRNYSVFEGFWLIKNPLKVLEDGVIKCLKQGVNVNHQIRFRNLDNSFDILKKEVVLGGGDSELKISDGGFNVSVSCVRRAMRRPRPIITFSNESSVSLKFD